MAAAGRRAGAGAVEPAAAEALVRTALGPGAAITQRRRICGLWSDYGSVEALRVTTTPAAPPAGAGANAPAAGGGGERALILKDVRPPRGDSSVGHLRKVASYVNECAFYTHVAPWVLRAAGSGCALPTPLAVASSPPDSFRLLLSDLTAGYGEAGRGGVSVLQPVYDAEALKGEGGSPLDLGRAQAALGWLAEFHALFWEEEGGGGDAPPPPPPPPAAAAAAQAHAAGKPDAARLLAERGTYWYLATRREELAAIPARGEWAGLAAAAPALDAALSPPAPRRGFSIVHGDFKSENIVFCGPAGASRGGGKSADDGGGGKSAADGGGASGWAAAAYDFQYVGRGCVMADVAYLLATSVDAGVLRAHEAALLEGYRSGLLAALARRGAGAGGYPARQMISQFELCLADFARFQAGWGWWGAARWTGARTRDVLSRLDAVLLAAAGE